MATKSLLFEPRGVLYLNLTLWSGMLTSRPSKKTHTQVSPIMRGIALLIFNFFPRRKPSKPNNDFFFLSPSFPYPHLSFIGNPFHTTYDRLKPSQLIKINQHRKSSTNLDMADVSSEKMISFIISYLSKTEACWNG